MIFIHMIIIVYMMIFVFIYGDNGCIDHHWLDENLDIVSYPEVSIRAVPEATEENQNWMKVLEKMRLDGFKMKLAKKSEQKLVKSSW